MKNVLLVFGGDSYEHDISIVTASQIYNKTRIDGVNLIKIYLSKDNRFYFYDSKEFKLTDFKEDNLKRKNKHMKEVVFVSGEKNKVFLKNSFRLKEYVCANDVILACHGGIGENGELVSFFKNLGFGTSAGDVISLGLSMDKFLFKQVMSGLKVPVLAGFKMTKFEFLNEYQKFKYKFNYLGFPLIVKSNKGGSSIGLFVVKNRVELKEKLEMAFEFDDEVLIEKYCDGAREFNVAVIGTIDDFFVSEVDEPMKIHEVLTFADKYVSGEKSKGKIGSKNSMVSQKRKLPADISLQLRDKIRGLARKIFVGLKLSGVVRIDFLYSEKNDKVYVCEVNAIPGSLAYYFFEENLITANYLIEKLLDVCEFNRLKNKSFKKEFFTNILG